MTITSKVPTKEYRDNFDRIFSKDTEQVGGSPGLSYPTNEEVAADEARSAGRAAQERIRRKLEARKAVCRIPWQPHVVTEQEALNWVDTYSDGGAHCGACRYSEPVTPGNGHLCRVAAGGWDHSYLEITECPALPESLYPGTSK